MPTTHATGHCERLRCSVCGDLIGVYEPLIVMETVGPRVTSIAREPRLRYDGEVDAAHDGCADGLAGRGWASHSG